MSIEIDTTDIEPDTWNDYVDRASQTSPFHRFEVLDLLARQCDSKLHTLVGVKGQEPVGILPVFESETGPFQQVVSPPGMEIFSLGPSLMQSESIKQRKGERRHRRFVDGCLNWIEERIDPDYTDIRTVDGYADLRPFIWRGYDVSPAYTYIVDLTPDEQTLLKSFSRDARSNIQKETDEPMTIRESGVSGIESVIGHIKDRYDTQDESYPLTTEFVTDLYHQLPNDAMGVYTVETDDRTVGGMVTLAQGDTVYRWQGGAKTESNIPINDMLDWRIMCDAKSRGFTRYDLVGANLPRLCRYKSKFNPDPEPYYVAKDQSLRMRATVAVYHHLQNHMRIL